MDSENDTLVLLHVILRHGEHAPDETLIYPRCKIREDNFYPYSYGVLTNRGKRNIHHLAKKLRSRYDEYLGEIYAPTHVEISSSNQLAALQSARIFLGTLYQPVNSDGNAEIAEWTTIHTNCNLRKTHKEIGVSEKEIAEDLYDEVFDTEYGRRVLWKYEWAIVRFEINTGYRATNTRKLFNLRELMDLAEMYQIPLSNWQTIISDDLLQATYDEYKIQTCTEELKWVNGGYLLQQLIMDTRDKVNQLSQRKLHAYIARDTDITGLLTAMGLMYDHIPQYGSSLTFEVHKIEERYGFKLYYKTDKETDFDLMTFVDGETIWWLDDAEEFINALSENYSKPYRYY